MSEIPAAVFFDVDGTLVDSNYLHVDAWGRAFAEAGFAVDAWRIHRGIGMDGSRLLADLLGEETADGVGDRLQSRHSELYLESAWLLRPFAHARDLVRAVAERGLKAVIVTSAPPDELARLKEVLDLDDVVDEFVAGEDVESAKPAPDLVEVALGRADVAADQAVFVGDSVWDVEAAKRLGVPTIGLLTGGTSEAELLEAGAVAVYADAGKLLEKLDGSPWRVSGDPT